MKIKFPPAPWKAQKDIRHSTNRGVITQGRFWWAVYGKTRLLKMEEAMPWLSEEEKEANAFLIAAAPELYEACQWALKAERALPENMHHKDLLKALEGAITKAE